MVVAVMVIVCSRHGLWPLIITMQLYFRVISCMFCVSRAHVLSGTQIIVCLCDAFSRPQYVPAVRQSPRSSPSFTPKTTAAAAGDTGAGDADDAEPSDVGVCCVFSS